MSMSGAGSPGTRGERQTRHIRLFGRVQGVWFRNWAIGLANDLGIDGWVRNCRDGSIELLISGPRAAVDQMIEACGTGPPLARVDHVSINPAPDFSGRGFEQRPTR